MSTIPPHYSDRYVGQRFNKALHIVQHLSPSSSFQPTKEQKLELYALYKQAAQGNVNTQRPGIFDVVGRAKWDAWKKLEGVNSLEAKHRYVEVLLRVAVEAYRKPASKAQAHQIIQAFATMQPSGDHTDDEDSGTSDDDETSVASADAEEQAYLLEIQQQDKSGRRTATPSRSSSTGMYRPPVSPTLSRASAHSAAAARYYNSNNNNNNSSNSRVMRGSNNSRAQMRAPSAASSVTGAGNGGVGRRLSQASSSVTANTNYNNKKRTTTTTSNNNNNNNNNRLGGGMFVEQVTEPFDPHVNPWAQQPSTVRQYKVDDGHSENSSMNNDPPLHHHHHHQQQQQQQQQHPHHLHQQRPSVIQLPSPVISATSTNATLLSSPAQPPQRHLQSPSSAASSMTATGPPPVTRVEGGLASSSSVVSQSTNNNNNNNNSLLTDQQYTSVVALGPATKRALDTLQAEIIALNDRIDGLRQELVERDRHKASNMQDDDGDDDDSNSRKESWDGWRWVVKAAVKHAAVNLLMASLLFLALYRQKSPVAYVILGQVAKYWRRTKLRLTISKILV